LHVHNEFIPPLWYNQIMKILDLIERGKPEPWSEADNLPWNEPEFSRRMLAEHLNQSHDSASRRFVTINRHVQFIHHYVLNYQRSQILDLGCGPGFYTERLARLGHTCRGIDFSPASIEYARKIAESDNLRCLYTLSDLRKAEFDHGFSLVMLLFGEFNVFQPDDARLLLEKAFTALEPGGRLLLEASPAAHIRRMGQESPTWYTSPGGLFDAGPHLVITESFWDQSQQAATNRWFVFPAEGPIQRYAASYQAYSDSKYTQLLESCGFHQVQFRPSLLGEGLPAPDFIVIVAHKPL
jgi:SAM-dependent methyltransferase